MPNLSFHPGFSGAMLLAAAIAAIALVAVSYRRAFASLTRVQWLCLYSLRMAAIVIVLLLLFRPVLSFQRVVKERPDLAFLIDNSASMSIADSADGRSRLDQAASRLVDWLGRLKNDFRLHAVAFSDSVVQLEREEEVLELAPTGQATSLSRALAAAGGTAPGKRLGAVFLLSDGIHNSAGDPLEAARRLGVRVHTVGVGDSLRASVSYRDVRLTDLECPDELPVDNLARLKARVDAVGFRNRVAKIVLREDDRQVDARQLVLDDAEGPQEVMFEFTPTVKGIHTYTAEAVAGPDEKIAQNNERSASALVVDARIRVLYLEGTLRREFGALVGQFLAKDPNVEFCALHQPRTNVFVQRSNIEDLQLDGIPAGAEQLEGFDVFLIGDLDSSYFQAEQLELLRKRVLDGAGLIMIGGYHSLGPGGYADTQLAEALPVFLGSREVGQIDESFQLQLTPDGRQHPIFANIRGYFPASNRQAEIAGLPPLEGCVRLEGVKPGATVLAVHPVETLANGGPMPVMAVQPFGKGRSAVFTADTTWLWRQTLLTMEQQSPFRRFWGQTVRWLAGRSEAVETEAGVIATTDKAYYQPESQMTISAVVRGSEGEAATGAKVLAVISGPEGDETRVSLAPIAGPAGHFSGQFEPQRSGQYEIVVDAQVGDVQLTADKLTVNVGRPNLEFDRLDLDDKMLTGIASETGGRYVHITTADRLIDRLQQQLEARRVEYEVGLSWPPLLWVLFVSALCGEWILRRRWQLR